MTNPFPRSDTAGTPTGGADGRREFVQAAWTGGELLAVWATTGAPERLWRCYVTGPVGSSCQLYVSAMPPAQALTDLRALADATAAGEADYAEWSNAGGLHLPSGWNTVWRWTGGQTGPTSAATVRLVVSGD